MEIVWTRAADCDLARISDYLEAQSPRVARAFVRRIFKAVDSLAEMPRMGKPVHLEMPTSRKFRALVVGHLKLFYFIDSNQIVIARLWDTRQDPSKFFIPSRQR